MRRDSAKVGDHPSFALNSAFSNQVYVLLLEKLVKSSPGKVAISPSFSPPPRCNASYSGEGGPPPPLISGSRSLSFPPILPAIIHFFYFFCFAPRAGISRIPAPRCETISQFERGEEERAKI